MEETPGRSAVEPSRRESQSVDHWYGWQFLISDGVALTLFAVGTATERESIRLHDGFWAVTHTTGALLWPRVGELHASPVFDVALSVYTLAPLIHAFHRRPEPAAASFALRLAAPFVGAVIFGMIGGFVLGNAELAAGRFRNAVMVNLGAFVGFGIPIVADAVLFSHERVEAAPRVNLDRSGSSLQIHPSINVAHNGVMMIGLSGAL